MIKRSVSHCEMVVRLAERNLEYARERVPTMVSVCERDVQDALVRLGEARAREALVGHVRTQVEFEREMGWKKWTPEV